MDDGETNEATRAELDARIEDVGGMLRVALLIPIATGGKGSRRTLDVRPITLADWRIYQRAAAAKSDTEAFDVLVDRLAQPTDLHLQITCAGDVAALSRAVVRQIEKFLRSGG